MANLIKGIKIVVFQSRKDLEMWNPYSQHGVTLMTFPPLLLLLIKISCQTDAETEFLFTLVLSDSFIKDISYHHFSWLTLSGILSEEIKHCNNNLFIDAFNLLK